MPDLSNKTCPLYIEKIPNNHCDKCGMYEPSSDNKCVYPDGLLPKDYFQLQVDYINITPKESRTKTGFQEFVSSYSKIT